MIPTLSKPFIRKRIIKRAENESCAEIAKTYGVTRKRISDILIEEDIRGFKKRTYPCATSGCKNLITSTRGIAIRAKLCACCISYKHIPKP